MPVDPDANLVNAMQAGATGLRLGKVLMLFPEGERSIDGELKKFRKGASILAAHLDVPIVPVAIDGLSELLAPRPVGSTGAAAAVAAKPRAAQFGPPMGGARPLHGEHDGAPSLPSP